VRGRRRKERYLSVPTVAKVLALAGLTATPDAFWAPVHSVTVIYYMSIKMYQHHIVNDSSTTKRRWRKRMEVEERGTLYDLTCVGIEDEHFAILAG